MLDKIPPELLYEICIWLSPLDIWNISQTCNQLKDMDIYFYNKKKHLQLAMGEKMMEILEKYPDDPYVLEMMKRYEDGKMTMGDFGKLDFYLRPISFDWNRIYYKLAKDGDDVGHCPCEEPGKSTLIDTLILKAGIIKSEPAGFCCFRSRWGM